MTITTVTCYDATHDNIGSLPHGQTAGYATGSGSHIRWTAQDWAAHPGAVRIDQDPAASDPSADILDVEQGAATPADCPGWAKAALSDYRSAARPGQRAPAIYVNLSNRTAVVNALAAGGVMSGTGLWLADWNLSAAAARSLVENGSGPFPVIGVQYRNAGAYDISVFSVPWLSAVSGPQPPAWTETLVRNLPSLAQPATGEDVKTLQGCLAARGFAAALDGAFGPATAAALAAFQRSRGLAADSVAGPLSWAKLLNR